MNIKSLTISHYFFRNFFESLKDFRTALAGVFSLDALQMTVRGGKLMAIDNNIETSADTASTATGKKSARSRTRASKKTTAGTRKAGASAPIQQSTPDPDVRFRMIQEAAYHIAEKNGFQAGREEANWLEAERQIDGSIIS